MSIYTYANKYSSISVQVTTSLPRIFFYQVYSSRILYIGADLKDIHRSLELLMSLGPGVGYILFSREAQGHSK